MQLDISKKITKKWLIWCHLNKEQDILESLFGESCVSIRGATKDDEKIEKERLWREGDVNVLITKPSVFGFGMNWQHAHNMVFVGMDDSFEKLYQAVRRQYRFGQKEIVNVHIITAESEGAVKANIQRKQNQHNEMSESMISHMREIMQENMTKLNLKQNNYKPTEKMELPKWMR